MALADSVVFAFVVLLVFSAGFVTEAVLVVVAGFLSLLTVSVLGLVTVAFFAGAVSKDSLFSFYKKKVPYWGRYLYL